VTAESLHQVVWRRSDGDQVIRRGLPLAQAIQWQDRKTTAHPECEFLILQDEQVDVRVIQEVKEGVQMTNECALAFVAALTKGKTGGLLEAVMGRGRVATPEAFEYKVSGIACDLADELVGQLEEYTVRLRSIVEQNRQLLVADLEAEKANGLPFMGEAIEAEGRKGKRRKAVAQ